MLANEFRFNRDEKSGLIGPASCNTLDFHTCSFGQGTNLHHGSGWPMFGEIFGVDFKVKNQFEKFNSLFKL